MSDDPNEKPAGRSENPSEADLKTKPAEASQAGSIAASSVAEEGEQQEGRKKKRGRGRDNKRGRRGAKTAEDNQDPPARKVEMREVTSVLVRFRVPDQVDEFDAGNLALKRADTVLVEADRGQDVGTVIQSPRQHRSDKAMRQVVRVVGEDDERVIDRNRVREREAHLFCVERIKAHNVPMKLISVDLAHSGTRALFYFSSADRVDFRQLVKDLARRFHTRIEMRQIGVRDAARHTGGIGSCGRELCCATWLPGFKPISIRMAKDQNLSLNHQKLSGLCGRLRCCLQYEQSLYQEQRKGLPKLGKRVITPTGEGRVRDLNVLTRRVRVQLADGSLVDLGADEVSRPPDPRAQPPKKTREAKAQQTSAEQKGTDATPDSDEEKMQQAAPAKRKRRRRGKRRRGGRGGKRSEQDNTKTESPPTGHPAPESSPKGPDKSSD